MSEACIREAASLRTFRRDRMNQNVVLDVPQKALGELLQPLEPGGGSRRRPKNHLFSE
jgi:hypothetical protein